MVGSLVDKESKENNKNVSLNAEAQNRLIRLKQEQNVHSKKTLVAKKEEAIHSLVEKHIRPSDFRMFFSIYDIITLLIGI